MWNIKIFFILAIFISFKSCSAQVLQFGVCTEVETMKYFDLENFLGKWYEIERFPTWYEEDGNCAYKFINQCGRRIEIEHGFVRNEIQYILHVNSSYTPGDVAVFKIKKSNVDPIGIPLSIITTDYSNYAIVYGCRNRKLLGISVKYISVWILSRHPTLSEEILEQAHQELNSIPNAYVAYLQSVPQTDEYCKYAWTAHVNAEDIEINDDDDFIEDD